MVAVVVVERVAFSALTLLVGHQEEHLSCKKGAGFVICLERGANDFHTI